MEDINSSYENRSATLIRTVKKVPILNKTTFLKRFPIINALQ